ncbi:MAG: hypothetical protein OEZ36_10465 [Spirochaetota bacterium]|nr:hypothetical protein [Spirochaetota bacterium]
MNIKTKVIAILAILIFAFSCDDKKKPETKPEPKKGNPIDALIEEAKDLGDNQANYKEALKKLKEAENYGKDKPGQEKKNPKAKITPTAKQLETIRQLKHKYGQLLKIDNLIVEARDLMEKKKYNEALAKLKKAKGFKDPEPTDAQKEAIDALIKEINRLIAEAANKAADGKGLKHLPQRYWDPGSQMWVEYEY